MLEHGKRMLMFYPTDNDRIWKTIIMDISMGLVLLFPDVRSSVRQLIKNGGV